MPGDARPRAAHGHPPLIPPRGQDMPFIEAADHTALFVTDWGSGPPVVFIHAWGLRSDQWNYQVPALAAAGLRCVLYDPAATPGPTGPPPRTTSTPWPATRPPYTTTSGSARPRVSAPRSA